MKKISSTITDNAPRNIVTNNITRSLTPAEQSAVDQYRQAIFAAGEAISSIPVNALVPLKDGTIVKSADVKAAWNNTSFVINDSVANGGPAYSNGSGRGEAAWNSGNPTVSQNIDNIVNYHGSGTGALGYLVLHEIGHLVEDNRILCSLLWRGAGGGYTAADADRVETQANDIASAIAHYGGLQILRSPNPSGYTDPNYTFTTSPDFGAATCSTTRDGTGASRPAVTEELTTEAGAVCFDLDRAPRRSRRRKRASTGVVRRT